MFIKYSKVNNHNLSLATGKDSAVLRPGWNEFPSHIWKENEKNPEVIRMLKNKDIEISDVVVSIKEGKKTSKVELGKVDGEVHLTDIKDEAKCIEIVKATFMRDILSRWSEEEMRFKVKKVITAQLEPLLNPKTESA